MKRQRKLGAIILAAGKGTRMNSKTVNKVVLPLGGKPMILNELNFLESLSIEPIIVVVGFAKDSVLRTLGDKSVIYAFQKKRLGTAHAVKCALKILPKDITDVIVIQGDDSLFYRASNKGIIKKLIDNHYTQNTSITLLTVELENPSGLGRIIRDRKSNILEIIEEKNATEEQKRIQEINSACYVFSVSFLKKYLQKLQKNSITREYYLTDLIALAVKNKEKIEALNSGKIHWRGVNTKEELQAAEKLLMSQTVKL